MIPKIIHYCWFGGNPLPELAQKCIESWKKYCPDYEIKRWDENNFDVNCCDYVCEAYEAKKWAFVSDYARFKILYENGGVYFDTDVELIKNIDDILEKGSFVGLECPSKNSKDKLAAAPGLGIAATPGMGIYKEILNEYDNSHFVKNENGSYKTVVTRFTDILLKYGNIDPNCISIIDEINVYPVEYFCPLNYFTGELKITKNTRAIHHYCASWVDKESKIIFKIRKNYCSKGGISKALGNIVIFVLKSVRKVRMMGIKGSIKYIWHKHSNANKDEEFG